jgi:hypothetical protein
MYLIYQLESECEKEFTGLKIELSSIIDSGISFRPKSITLEQLLKAKIKV